MKHYLIYKITCSINNKIYIGKHKTDDIDDDYMGSGSLLKYDQDLFGIDKFKREILFECKSEEEMNAKEAEIVNEDFIARDDVYNIKLGGDGGWDHINSNKALKSKITRVGAFATRDKIRSLPKEVQAEFWKKITNKVQLVRSSWSEEYKDEVYAKVSNALKEFYRFNKNPMFGKHHTIKTREKLSETHKGKKNPMHGKMWICNDETHESKSILKTDPIPEGWRKGRFCK